MNTPGKRALYDNLDKDEALALAVDAAVRTSRQDDWRSNQFKIRRVRNAIRAALEGKPGLAHETPEPYGGHSSETLEEQLERILALVKNQDEY
jgi:type I restriction enzyme R subunit